MENASKALIIAGAILLSILIISLGIMIYNQASGVANKNSMSEVEITVFNQKFLPYGGKNVKGSQLNALLNVVVQHNVANQEDASKKVNVVAPAPGNINSSNWQGTMPTTTGVAPMSIEDTGKAMSSKTYSVTLNMNSKTGLVQAVVIIAN